MKKIEVEFDYKLEAKEVKDTSRGVCGARGRGEVREWEGPKSSVIWRCLRRLAL